jgi:hypothetical protein
MFKRTVFVVSNNFMASQSASYSTRFAISVVILFFSMWLEVHCYPYSTNNYNLISTV